MRVLVVCSFKEGLPQNAAPFVLEQMEALRRCHVECDMFLVKGKGIRGYLRQLRPLKEKIASFHPDVVHAHFGLCGLLANLQRKVPVVTTYHGSDINDPKVLRFSRISMKLSAWNVFVSKKTFEIAHPRKNYSLLPCGIDLSDLQLTFKADARYQMHLDQEKPYILFAGAFDNPVKNAPLAREAVGLLGTDDVELLELKGYTRDEVTLLMRAADVFLMTSLTEGSPQVVKEALACGCPIVSVDVGDVRERVDGVKGCFVADSNDSEELAGLLRKALAYAGRTNGREKIIANGLDNQSVIKKLIEAYKKVNHKYE